MCLVGSVTFSIIQASDNICLMSSLSRTDYTLMLIKENLSVMLEGCLRNLEVIQSKTTNLQILVCNLLYVNQTVDASNNTIALNCYC